MIKVVGQKRTVKEFIWNFSNDISVWWHENKDWAIFVVPVIPIAAGTGAWLIKKGVSTALASRMLAKEKALKELYIYDRGLGMYHKLRRPLRSGEAVRINELKKGGMALAEILRNMKLI